MVLPLARAAELARLLAERDSASLLLRIRWTQPQLDFLSAIDPRPILLRTGNQWLGKSTVGAADVLYRCQGDHPYDPRGRIVPCAALVVSPTDQHSIQLQEKVWELADKSTLEPGQAFVPGKGMRGRHPILRFRNGSRVTFRTAKQGGLALSGGTFDHVLIDELVDRRIYNELLKRIERRNGTMRLTLTPINAPADWLRKECEAGRIVDLHYRCEARWCIPVGSTQPLRDARTGLPMDEAWIRGFIARTDPHEVEVTVHGGWQILHVDRSFAAWDDALLIRGSEPIPDLSDLAIGIDYGEDPGRWVMLLVARAVDGTTLVLGEWSGSGRDTVETAAAGLERMCAEWGATPSQIPRWVGDINTAGILGGGRQMNEVLGAEMRRRGHRVAIQAAFKQAGSVDARFQLLNTAMARRKIWIHEVCSRLVDAVRQLRRGSQEAGRLKDPIDALWYVAEPWVREAVPRLSRVAIR